MKKGPFKMKGNPIKRNFGIGSPMKKEKIIGPVKPMIDKDKDGIPLGIDIKDSPGGKQSKVKKEYKENTPKLVNPTKPTKNTTKKVKNIKGTSIFGHTPKEFLKKAVRKLIFGG